MGTINEINALLATEGLGTVGTDLFSGYMPDKPDACGCVYEYGGERAELGFGVAGVQFENPSVQVVFRGAPQDYAGPRAAAETAYRALAEVQATTLSSTRYLIVHPKQSPFEMKRDEAERVYIACNFDVRKEPSAPPASP